MIAQVKPSQSMAIIDDSVMVAQSWAVLRKKNPELPEHYNLTTDHENHLSGSGINKLQAAIAGIFSADPDLAAKLTGHAYGGLVFSYFDHSGVIYKWLDDKGIAHPFFRLRPDNERAAKYLSPAGAPPFVYVPRTSNHIWATSQGDFRPRQQIVCTEGEKKALCATLSGVPCLGLGGVSSYATGGRGDEGGPRDLGFFINELNLLDQKRLTIVFDSDVTQKDEVAGAIRSFAYTLCEAYRERELSNGAKIVRKTLKLGDVLRYSLLPSLPSGKCGLDDAIVGLGVDPVKELLDNALPLVDLAPAKEDKKDITIAVLFCAEPLGDKAHKKSPLNAQRHARSLIAWLSSKEYYATCPELGYLRYSTESGIWESISQEQWRSLPERVADLNRWQNRQQSVMAQTQNLLSARLLVERSRFNGKQYLGFLNGTLNLQDMIMEDHSPRHYLTQRLGFAYDPNATCNRWLDYLINTFSEQREDGSFDEDSDSMERKVNLVRALLRWSLEPKESTAHDIEVFPYLIGPPGYGKGTFLEVLQGLAGQAAGNWSLSMLTNPNGVASIAGKLVSINPEFKGSLTAESASQITRITTNEYVEVKILYKNSIQQRCNTVLWAASNNSILSDLSDREGVDRRTVYLEFKRKPAVRDSNLKKDLLKELPGIFNWVWGLSLDEAICVIKGHFTSAQYFADQVKALEASNSVYQWIVDPDPQPGAQCPKAIPIRIADLYGHYQTWCAATGTKPLKQRNFSSELVKAGSKVEKGDYMRYTIPAIKDISIGDMLGL